MTDQPTRPWWRKKRWTAAGLLAFAVCYPFSAGPAAYAVGRGWLPRSVGVVHRPLAVAADACVFAGQPVDADGRPLQTWIREMEPWHLRAVSDAAGGWWDYVFWCIEVGKRHRRAASD